MADVLPGSHNLTLYRGDSFTQAFTFTQGGVPLVLPASGWLCQVRASTSSDAVSGTFAVDSSGAGSGVVVISVTAAESAVFSPGVYDLQLTDGSAVRTYLRGMVTVTKDVSRV